VVAVENDSLKIRRDDGEETVFKLGQGSALCDVGEKRKLKVAAGDKLLLQANWQKKFVNGELVEVKHLASEAIILTDGRTIPADYRTFTHGYAVTSHAAQGKTVAEVLLVASARSLPAINQEQFYVSISRGRERCRVFTDDTEMLRSHVTDSSARLAAIEAMPQRDFLQTILQRGNRFLKRFRQHLAQSISTETTERSSHEIKPTEPRKSTYRIGV
jgi:ATP-dependent exoDNAse (exonuclease V) alpha subunit